MCVRSPHRAPGDIASEVFGAWLSVTSGHPHNTIKALALLLFRLKEERCSYSDILHLGTWQ